MNYIIATTLERGKPELQKIINSYDCHNIKCISLEETNKFIRATFSNDDIWEITTNTYDMVGRRWFACRVDEDITLRYFHDVILPGGCGTDDYTARERVSYF